VNTLKIAIPSVIGALLTNSLVAYGFSRVRWPGRDAVFALVLATLILPGFVTFIPLYVMFHRLGWINTYAPLIVPVFFANPSFIFLLRQFFMGLPVELSDAAGWMAPQSSPSSGGSSCLWPSRHWRWWRCFSSSGAGTTTSAR